jgi:glycosyltransferase involved in cell wall biosynthesis
MKIDPLVSVLIPVYNGEKYLELTIKKLLDQTYQNMEIIISDNNSEDSTKEICFKFCEIDKRIKYYKQNTNIGMIKNELFLSEKINGKYFFWMPAGDYIDKEFIKNGINYLEQNNDTISCFGETVYFQNYPEEIKRLKHTEIFNLTSKQRIKNFLNYQVADILLYGIHRSNIKEKIKPIENCINPELLQIFKIIESGKYKGLKEMCFYKHYPDPQNPRSKHQQYMLYRTKKNIANRYRVYCQILLKIFNHFNFFISIYLIKKLIIMRLFSKLKFIKLKPKPSEY